MRQEFTNVVRVTALLRCNSCCEACGGEVEPGKYHVDHIIPDGLGGKPILANAQILCNDCHNSKTRQTDIPRIAKTKRQQRKHAGTWRASRRPLPGSKRSRWKKPLRGRAELRTSE